MPTFSHQGIRNASRPSRSGRRPAPDALSSFDELDTDGDGVLSEDELKPIRHRLTMKKLDRNGDGVVSREEFLQERLGTARRVLARTAPQNRAEAASIASRGRDREDIER